MAKIKTIFPPQVPSFLPAFDKSSKYVKFYFRPSIANTFSELLGLHFIISRQDTNEDVLNTLTYPLGMVAVKKGSSLEGDEPFTIYEDKVKKYYYFNIPNSIFPKSDSAYKVQIRAISTKAGNSIEENKPWLDKHLDDFSEWSTVTIMMPITPPKVEIQGLDLDTINKINSSGYNFIGSFKPQPGGEKEVLNSYSMNLFTYQTFEDRNAWKLFASSGEKTFGIYEKINISHVFNKELSQDDKYVLAFTIKTKSLYTKTLMYKITCQYPAIELFNSINLRPDPEEGRIAVDLQAKQILFEEDRKDYSSVEFIPALGTDAPGVDKEYEYARVVGSIMTNENFSMNAEDDKWVLQTVVMMNNIHSDIKEAYRNPFITMTTKAPVDKGDVRTISRIKLICMKINLTEGYSFMSQDGVIREQEPDWEYRFIARKEKVYIDRFGNEDILLTQDSVFRTKEKITTQSVYYLYLKEDQGYMDLQVIKIKERIRGIKTWLNYQE